MMPVKQNPTAHTQELLIVDKVDKVDKKKLTPYAVYYVGCDTMDRIRKKFTSGSHNSK